MQKSRENLENIQYPTLRRQGYAGQASNTEHRMFPGAADKGGSMLGVGCSLFDVSF
jgi:hypothetical protein